MVSSLLTQPLYIAIFYVVLLIAFWSDLRRTLTRSTPDEADRHDHNSRRLIAVTGGGGILVGSGCAYALPILAIEWRPLIVFSVGALLILAGGGLRQYAIRTLDQYFTTRVMIHSDQSVIEAGPYRWVRHPAYTGGLLLHLGIGVILANWASIGVVVLGIGIAYWYRIHVEEQTLREELGAEYIRYTKRTPYRLVPFIW